MHEKTALQIKEFANKFYPGLKFETAVVLGSGLGNFPSRFDNPPSVGYSELEGFSPSTAPGHEGRLYFLNLGGGVLCFSGRTHYYEGKGIDKVVYPVKVMKKVGIKNLLLTNAAGGINPDFKVGDFMIITDHINMIPNPLVGGHDPELGVRFPDMTTAYDKQFREIIKTEAGILGIPMREGVYISLTGPSYETPAEIKAYRTLGADAVGMSTVPEVIEARRCGIRVCAITLISNAAAGMNKEPLTEQEVIDAGKMAASRFGNLAERVLTAINGKSEI
jgi:purine-nucleoside phosphorylase